MNIFIFSNVPTYRKTLSSFYFLIGSIINIVYILINLTTRIINAIYLIDLTNYSRIWCKIVNFSICAFSQITFICSYLTTIDQFLATSRTVHLPRYSNIKLFHQIIFIIIIFYCLHGIPTLLYANIILPTNTCTYSNNMYRDYVLIYILSFFFVLFQF